MRGYAIAFVAALLLNGCSRGLIINNPPDVYRRATLVVISTENFPASSFSPARVLVTVQNTGELPAKYPSIVAITAGESITGYFVLPTGEFEPNDVHGVVFDIGPDIAVEYELVYTW